MFFVHCRNAKTKDPTIFSKNSTILEASACRLQLPEVKNPENIRSFSYYVIMQINAQNSALICFFLNNLFW